MSPAGPASGAADDAAAAGPVRIVHEDADCLVVDKPGGLLAVPGRGADMQDCLSARLQAIVPEALVVHRLDMSTSGLLLFARHPAAQRALSIAFAQREVHKRYVAVVDGILENGATGEIALPVGADWPRRPRQQVDPVHGKPALTRYRVVGVDRHGHCSRVELEPVTGRTHQLRVHLAAIGHPILGDALYAPDDVVARSARLLLHASELGFARPAGGVALRIVSVAPF